MAILIDETDEDTQAISSEELSQRVAILRRFRTLLEDQRERFRSYLEVLDKHQDVIETGSVDDLLTHVELEEKIVADIFAIQKVIDPLDTMYRSISGSQAAHSENVPELKAALEDLKNEAIVRSARNKDLLSKRMVELRSEIQALRNNPYAGHTRRSSFDTGTTASLVDIEG